ncbi:unnamed protein product [Acanthoscelides obtectus]|uniref:Uncharacterized protein n=1 Tax=Acanthoscelides obtectus TaxID=200917 RepID=A0A9P0QG74_ACAOB|nr:unnamed protein product [Acanthoscelides obtectus]CAK1688006.1 hypothetical protein AOBTE_LOCUS36512 [Acanthoscelides obtectus]
MKAVFEEKKRKSPEKEKKTKKNKEDYNKENCAEGKCNKAKLTTDREVKSKKTTTRNKRAKKAKKYLFNSDDEDSSNDQIDERTICDDESEFSEEETLCAIGLGTGQVGRCGTDAEVAETGPMKNALEVIVQLLIFVHFVWIRKILVLL